MLLGTTRGIAHAPRYDKRHRSCSSVRQETPRMGPAALHTSSISSATPSLSRSIAPSSSFFTISLATPNSKLRFHSTWNFLSSTFSVS